MYGLSSDDYDTLMCIPENLVKTIEHVDVKNIIDLIPEFHPFHKSVIVHYSIIYKLPKD